MQIRKCKDAEDFDLARQATRAYIDWIDIDLGFQDIESELRKFEEMYGPPGGCFLIGLLDDKLAGGVGLRSLGEGICEMKRLYVYDHARGNGLAEALCRKIISKASGDGYRKMRLDTLDHMVAARGLYGKLGFVEIDAYRFNPHSGTIYMELDLGNVPGGPV